MTTTVQGLGATVVQLTFVALHQTLVSPVFQGHSLVFFPPRGRQRQQRIQCLVETGGHGRRVRGGGGRKGGIQERRTEQVGGRGMESEVTRRGKGGARRKRRRKH